MTKIVTNPDEQKIYHVWHYCNKCKKAYDHSQGSCDRHRTHDYISFPMGQETAEVD